MNARIAARGVVPRTHRITTTRRAPIAPSTTKTSRAAEPTWWVCRVSSKRSIDEGHMLKLPVAVVAVALAGTAAAGWRDLRVDGGSEEAFAQSMATFKQELSPARQYVFGEALKDIWIQSATAAEAAQREYT